jgi:hypothetical protein
MQYKLPFLIPILLILTCGYRVDGQSGVAINSDGTTVDSKAMLDVKSTTKGVLIPRMSRTQRTAIASPTMGLIVYDTDSLSLYYYHNGWHEVLDGGNEKAFVDIDDGGFITLVDTASVWDDIVVPLNQARQGSNLKPTFDETNVGFLFPQNDASAIMYLIVQISHKWKEGTTLYPHVHWQQSSASTPSFYMDYKWFNANEAIPAAWTTGYSFNSFAFTYSSGNLHQIATNATGISGSGKKISSILLIKLYRNDNVAIGNVLAFQFDIHMEINSMGSRQQYIK